MEKPSATGKATVFPMNSMKVHTEGGVIAPFILKRGTRRKLVRSLTPLKTVLPGTLM
jgi:hypothetical protein